MQSRSGRVLRRKKKIKTIDKKKKYFLGKLGSFDYEGRSVSKSKISNSSLDPGGVCKSLRKIGNLKIKIVFIWVNEDFQIKPLKIRIENNSLILI